MFFLLLEEHFVVKFDNGELKTVGVRHLEPEDDFSPPQLGDIMCAQIKGTKYVCVIVEEVSVKVCIHIFTCQ